MVVVLDEEEGGLGEERREGKEGGVEKSQNYQI